MSQAQRQRFERAQAAYRIAYERLSNFEVQLHSRYGPGLQDSWLTGAHRKKRTQLRAARDRAGDRVSAALEGAPRDWSRGVPAHWIYSELSSEDAFRPLSEQLSVTPPRAYGYADNPKRPPRNWFNRCVRSVRSAGKVEDPNAICGALWYRKMDPAAKRQILRRSGDYEENPPDNALLIGGAVVVAGVLAFLFLKVPAKAAGCAPASDVTAYANSRGMAVTLFAGLPTSKPPAGYNAATAAAERIYNTNDCAFYKWQSFDGAKNAWTRDDKLTGEFNTWRAAKK